MTEIIENALIIQNDDGFFPKDWTRHLNIFASWGPSKQAKVEKYQQTSASYYQAIIKRLARQIQIQI